MVRAKPILDRRLTRSQTIPSALLAVETFAIAHILGNILSFLPEYDQQSAALVSRHWFVTAIPYVFRIVRLSEKASMENLPWFLRTGAGAKKVEAGDKKGKRKGKGRKGGSREGGLDWEALGAMVRRSVKEVDMPDPAWRIITSTEEANKSRPVPDVGPIPVETLHIAWRTFPANDVHSHASSNRYYDSALMRLFHPRRLVLHHRRRANLPCITRLPDINAMASATDLVVFDRYSASYVPEDDTLNRQGDRFRSFTFIVGPPTSCDIYNPANSDVRFFLHDLAWDLAAQKQLEGMVNVFFTSQAKETWETELADTRDFLKDMRTMVTAELGDTRYNNGDRIMDHVIFTDEHHPQAPVFEELELEKLREIKEEFERDDSSSYSQD